MAFRKKADTIFNHNPDILIVPECENLERLNFENCTIKPNDSFWHGNNPNKGLGIFTFGDFKIEPIEGHNPNFNFVVPLRIINDQVSFIVLAVWTQKPLSNDFYVIQIYDAVNYYSELLNSENVIIAGDFNSNSIWDKPRKEATHSNMVEILKSKGILSAYHHYYNQNHGEEDQMTLYMQRKQDKGYHIDYCFASSSLIDNLSHVEVGKYEDWTEHSDHKPLIVNFNEC